LCFASEVSIAKDGEMMREVASDDESESAHGDVGETVGSGFGIFRAAKHGGNVSQVGAA
jgi:hypothetical protein